MSAVALGRTIGREFIVERPLGSGGMGAVFVALQTSTGVRRALKVMRPELLRDVALRERFVREARIGAAIPSDHVVQVITAGVDDETAMPFLVMELLEGEELSQAVRRQPIALDTLSTIFEQLCHGVGAAHRVGIVHRDLKPENIFLSRPRAVGSAVVVKVLDFGIAKIVADARARATEPAGTPLWMAPEQTERGSSVSPQTDVWALGLIAFFCLTGHVYWSSLDGQHPSVERLLREILIDDLLRPSTRAEKVGAVLPAWFDGWFERCVHRDPAARFADATEVWRDLDRCIRGQEPLAEPQPNAPDPSPDAVVEGQPRRAPSAGEDVAPVDPLGYRRVLEAPDDARPRSPDHLAGATSLAAASERTRGRSPKRSGRTWAASVVLIAGSLALRAMMRSPKSEPAPLRDESAAPPPPLDSAGGEREVESIVANWNAAHVARDAAALGALYADSVLYYGTQQSSDACIVSKRAFMVKNPDFTQQIVGEVHVVIQGSTARAEFMKRVLLRGRSTGFPSYLVFANASGTWRIVIEGDAVTDTNLAKKAAKASSALVTAVDGDFDGDGFHESVRLIQPAFPAMRTETNVGDCIGSCDCRLVFTNEKVPAVLVKSCIGGTPVNEGDLDGDGADEIGLLPGWWTSCWHGYNVYTLKHGTWRYLVDPISTHCNQWDDGVDAIERDRNTPGHVIVRYTDSAETSFKVMSKSIKVK